MLRYRNLIEALDAAPAERPFATFWVDEDEQETVTFGEFRRRARTQMQALHAAGAAGGERVVIIMPQSIAAMAVFAGAMMLGAVPAFLAYPNDKVDAAKYRSGLAGVTANLKARFVVIDRDFPEEMLEYVALTGEATVIRAGSGGGEEPSESNGGDNLVRNIPTDRIAFVQHSAGTTGLQKGVALTHAAVLRQLEHLAAALKIDADSDRIYNWLPLYHDMGLIACFMLPMVYHLPLVMQSPLDWVMVPETMLEVITAHKCTLGWMPNFAFQFVPRRVREERRARYDLSSLRVLINCSEPVRTASMLEFETAFAANGLHPGALQSCYAMAENVFAVSQSAVDSGSGPARIYADGKEFRGLHRIVPAKRAAPDAMCFTSSGRLLPNHEARIVSDSGEDREPGSAGEILIKSDCLFEGYYNRPDLTVQATVDGWYRTGDLGFLLDGELYVVGRKKDLIIVGGENLYPQDLEEIAGKHAAIHDGRVIAMGLYNADLGTEEIVMVAEVESEDHLANAPEIDREIRQLVMTGMGVAVGTIFLKPPKWIVKSTAGKLARSSTLEKLRSEHSDLKFE